MTTALPAPQPQELDRILLPRNLDAERSVLGACLSHPTSADYIVDKLSAGDFFRRSHQQIFEAIKALRARNVAIDLVPLRQELERCKHIDDVGGPAYLTALTDGVPRSTNVPHYVEILKDLHAKRALYHFAKLTIDHVGDNAHAASAILGDTDRRLMALQSGHVEGRMSPLSATVPGMLTAIEWAAAHKGELLGLTTGFSELDQLSMGWQVGDLTVIGARPSIGKTTLALNTAVAGAQALVAAGRTEAVAIFSFEMRRKQLEFRMLSALSGIPLSRLLSGYVADAEYTTMSAALETMTALPIEIDDQAGQTRWQIRSVCRRLKASRGVALIIIDYVQLIPGSLDRRGASRNEEVTDISRGMKELADEVGAPILLLSQLSRPNVKYGDPRPKLSDLRESGALEQDADNVAFLHRKNHREGGLTNFILEKQRNGPTGTVNLTLDRDTVSFSEGGNESVEPSPTMAPGHTRRVPRKAVPSRERSFID